MTRGEKFITGAAVVGVAIGVGEITAREQTNNLIGGAINGVADFFQGLGNIIDGLDGKQNGRKSENRYVPATEGIAGKFDTSGNIYTFVSKPPARR